uniref:nSTAND1 domain-containing NTPase n=1 Tax=Frankia sp. Cas3 TaxID=3073926 RepID=UPI002AD327FD
MARVFISHATEDSAVATEILEWLRADRHDPFLARDLAGGMPVGENWKQRLYQELRDADAVVCIVTESFVASNWCAAEVGIADSRGCRLLPLAVEAGGKHPLMEDLHYIRYYEDRQAARKQLADNLGDIVAGGRTTWRDGDNPFPGLRAFGSDLAQMFFGRSGETRELASLLRATSPDRSLLAVVGPSGCGKSSLMRAGLLPLFKKDPAWLVADRWVPGDDPVSGLAQALTVTANKLRLGWSKADVRAKLDNPNLLGLRSCAEELLGARDYTAVQWLLIGLDQAEELFTRAPAPERAQVAALLDKALAGPVRLVATLRSEFLDDLRTLPELVDTDIQPFLLRPLAPGMLPLVIKEPAKNARIQVEEELLVRLSADAESGDALPLLAFALHQLADGLSRGDTMTVEKYDRIGGVTGALTKHADAALADAMKAGALTEPEVLAGLVRLVTIDEAGRRARRQVRQSDLSEGLRRAFEVFVDRRLLVADHGAAGNWFRVTHEKLLTEWPPLDKAITEKEVVLGAARAVEQAAAEWENADQNPSFLWDANRVNANLTILGLPTVDEPSTSDEAVVAVNPTGQAFLEAHYRHFQKRREEEEETHREKEAAALLIRRQEQRYRKQRIGILSGFLFVAMVAAGVAFWQGRSARDAQHGAERARRSAIAFSMLVQSTASREKDPRDAFRFGIAAYNIDENGPETRESLVQLLASFPYRGITVAQNTSVTSVAFSPDSHVLATGSNDRGVRLWDVSSPGQPHLIGVPLTGHTGIVTSVAFSPDGRTLASGSNDNSVRLWDVSRPGQAHPLGEPLTGSDTVTSVAFSPDGHTLVSGSYDYNNPVRLWDLTTPTAPIPLGPLPRGHTGI